MERFTRQSASGGSSTSQSAAPASGGGSNNKKFLDGTMGSKLLVISLIVASFAVALAFTVSVWRSFSATTLVKEGQYQAVFLDNGQVYFGHLSGVNADYIRLTDIYYLQVEQQIQPEQEQADGETPQQQISLAKLGNELHGPEDEMFVLRSKIVFWENLKTEGQVTQAIENFVSGQQGENGAPQEGDNQLDN